MKWTTADQLQNSLSEDADYAIEVASWILYKLTAEKYPGIRTSTEWYGFDSSTCWCLLSDIRNLHLHRRLDPNEETRRLTLRHAPVRSVASVSVGGTVLDPSEYELVANSYLVRTNRTQWNFYAGVQVDYTYGQVPPVAGQRAAAVLADQLVLSFCGSDKCKLPDRVTSVSRQGMSFTVLDPHDFLDKGRTGIFEVDLFISAANPARAKQKPRVYSPDRPRRSVR